MRVVSVIGGGAAGMVAAIAAAREGCRVSIYEANEKLGKKLFITGKGRCNVTNACDMEELQKQVVTNPKFLYSAFYGFTNRDIMELLEANGCPVKVERGDRVFPVSDKSSDVIGALQRALRALKVTVNCNQPVKGLWVEDRRLKGLILKKSGEKVPSDAVILATGGVSYPSTGSTGDGYRIASDMGHTVTPLLPALVALETEEKTARDLQGLTLKNVAITVAAGKKRLYEDFGELLFTHFGVSGPVILSASSFVVKALKKGPLALEIDLKPALSEEQLDLRLLREFEACQNKQLKNALVHLYPSKLLPVMIERIGLSGEKKIHEVTREDRQAIIRATKHFGLTLTGTRDFPEAVITQGGVSVKEVHPSTMESKLLPGLFLAGEILDLDAVTGGFNLQIAWSSGYAAGKGAADKPETLKGETENAM